MQKPVPLDIDLSNLTESQCAFYDDLVALQDTHCQNNEHVVPFHAIIWGTMEKTLPKYLPREFAKAFAQPEHLVTSPVTIQTN